jgi:hypothetical protein
MIRVLWHMCVHVKPLESIAYGYLWENVRVAFSYTTNDHKDVIPAYIQIVDDDGRIHMVTQPFNIGSHITGHLQL